MKCRLQTPLLHSLSFSRWVGNAVPFSSLLLCPYPSLLSSRHKVMLPSFLYLLIYIALILILFPLCLCMLKSPVSFFSTTSLPPPQPISIAGYLKQTFQLVLVYRIHTHYDLDCCCVSQPFWYLSASTLSYCFCILDTSSLFCLFFYFQLTLSCVSLVTN